MKTNLQFIFKMHLTFLSFELTLSSAHNNVNPLYDKLRNSKIKLNSVFLF